MIILSSDKEIDREKTDSHDVECTYYGGGWPRSIDLRFIGEDTYVPSCSLLVYVSYHSLHRTSTVRVPYYHGESTRKVLPVLSTIQVGLLTPRTD